MAAKIILSGYTAYNFQDHDPILDQLDRLYERAGIDVKVSGNLTKVAHGAGMSPSTLYSWHIRKTKRPQWASVNAVVRSLGGQVTVSYEGKQIRPSGILK